MSGYVKKYTRWLHTQWPAGIVEKLPQVNDDFSTNVPGLYVVGDLTGIPLLKFSSDSGARAVQNIVADSDFQRQKADEQNSEIIDLVIIGAGVSGFAAAMEASKQKLTFEILEATEPFSTIVNFPKGKPIYTYPTDMKPTGELQFTAETKEDLIAELEQQASDRGIQPQILRVDKVIQGRNYFNILVHNDEIMKAKRVIIAIGRSGNFRKLGVPGENLDKVYNRLHDPKDFYHKSVLVVGGGDSALETAIALTQCGANVTLSYRKKKFNRPKPENLENLYALVTDPGTQVAVETPHSERVTTSTGGFLGAHRKPGVIKLVTESTVKNISETEVTLIDHEGDELLISNDAVFCMIGREAPLDFFRRSRIYIAGEMRVKQWMSLALFLLFCAFVYNWKAFGTLTYYFQSKNWFPFNINTLLTSISIQASDPATFPETLNLILADPGFHYSLVYTILIIVFGIKRIRRRQTPYIKAQTISLTLIQIIPLFLLPYLVLPYLDLWGAFDSGIVKTIADELLPVVDYGPGREYWRAFGFILAWPLFLWNVFSSQPCWGWLIISILQTFVFIPLIVYFWGKGAYCGWICSCGAMAETLGDNHRHKMVHGAKWNRLNMLGQVILGITFLLLLFRIISWITPQSSIGHLFLTLYDGMLNKWKVFGIQLNYKWVVDIFLAGIIGYGFYFWYSGRVWCRFVCPLAALMHIYARFSRFRILSDKKKCISCNVCTSVCHQGIDIMNFANKGLPMQDPECVRCSACVQSCPTGVLQFGQVDRHNQVIKIDKLDASPVIMREKEVVH